MEGLAFPWADSFFLKIYIGIIECKQFMTNVAASQITGLEEKKKRNKEKILRVLKLNKSAAVNSSIQVRTMENKLVEKSVIQ